MIEVTSLTKQPGDSLKQYQVQAFADTKDEVVPGAVFHNLPVDAEIQPGSTVITADGDVAFYKSDGTWNWV